jgi:hypothetical protein
MGGTNIRVEDTYAYGPGYYPHRMTVVKGKGDELPRTEGRHNMLSLVDYFASTNFPSAPSDIHFKNCVIENTNNILYQTAKGPLQSGTALGLFELENVIFTDLAEVSTPVGYPDTPLNVVMKNVKWDFADGVEREAIASPDGSNVTVSIE